MAMTMIFSFDIEIEVPSLWEAEDFSLDLRTTDICCLKTQLYDRPSDNRFVMECAPDFYDGWYRWGFFDVYLDIDKLNNVVKLHMPPRRFCQISGGYYLPDDYYPTIHMRGSYSITLNGNTCERSISGFYSTGELVHEVPVEYEGC
jgi:hypothetical protein